MSDIRYAKADLYLEPQEKMQYAYILRGHRVLVLNSVKNEDESVDLFIRPAKDEGALCVWCDMKYISLTEPPRWDDDKPPSSGLDAPLMEAAFTGVL